MYFIYSGDCSEVLITGKVIDYSIFQTVVESIDYEYSITPTSGVCKCKRFIYSLVYFDWFSFILFFIFIFCKWTYFFILLYFVFILLFPFLCLGVLFSAHFFNATSLMQAKPNWPRGCTYQCYLPFPVLMAEQKHVFFLRRFYLVLDHFHYYIAGVNMYNTFIVGTYQDRNTFVNYD